MEETNTELNELNTLHHLANKAKAFTINITLIIRKIGSLLIRLREFNNLYNDDDHERMYGETIEDFIQKMCSETYLLTLKIKIARQNKTDVSCEMKKKEKLVQDCEDSYVCAQNIYDRLQEKYEGVRKLHLKRYEESPSYRSLSNRYILTNTPLE